MRTIFIADAHLQHESDARYHAMLSFLDELCGTTETLYIMGDFFEFWLGYPEIPFPHYLPVLEALRKLRESGTDIIYFEGNHDFHIGPFFSETLGARIFPGPAALTIAGQKAYLCHGDQANPADIPYRLLRFVFHSSFTRWLTNVVPPWVACAIADHMGRKGREYLHLKGENPAFRNILITHAAKQFAKGYDLVVAGHFHIPFTETFPETPGKRLVSLGAWAAGLHYGELIDNEIILKQYR
ncbi:UDP-2,3-diacylglucosamine diphosphatase [Geobacter pelophilus]|uniref:UDP-2,3-diacylglucosamine diphosphatase n=1 Tax=Geoanaerobacter pelophilus TaxID=60036 RepID=A0AAW4LAC9_9BACT|nr:UDP-2,3-diacylglucosamine diphosphatase [Geoanaerobacter pelophilus]MBT0666038.1 UDP-2,3-diacylglucosamine diphosphatase [Geoanaerobacter pelophilus]